MRPADAMLCEAAAGMRIALVLVMMPVGFGKIQIAEPKCVNFRDKL
jgi:hypothetical protein